MQSGCKLFHHTKKKPESVDRSRFEDLKKKKIKTEDETEKKKNKSFFTSC
jgi:hypothetical protein